MNEGLLIEYGLFFENILKQHCTFVLDNDNSIGILNNVLLRIKESDKNAEIYVNTYGIDFIKENLYIYSDTLWINTVIGKKYLVSLMVFQRQNQVIYCYWMKMKWLTGRYH